ncbi:pyridoxal phosphate-dependent aminotransferase [Kineosporia rhizophila]|uniref:pyridoxal phosphate-dependent aminotransferase n=1 Tax=Kineosporia TaxID=49184 RepID=UPI001E537024|nr:pyridoxal phosphate-dependent aminotransferase [Kineosporia sp. NBRC 101677]MCE0535292.1 pyridoxal phosphate-dependent aminotransferase [Kineosporia rhizophila]GLY16928.1 aminotransferase AlaT [Kineosporia sp. NBRC 101677]
MEIRQSRKLNHVAYDVRGPVLAEAMRLEAQGHQILRLNIGNPAPFGFEAPEDILRDMILQLPGAHGYSDAKGIVPARRAVVQYHRAKGVTEFDIEDVWLGNGVSELISMALQALLNDGDELLVPSPDYPLWTATTTLAGGRAVHYVCDETSGWLPDLADVEAKITDRTVGLVIINPNNPTGAVYPREILEGLVEIARRHDLMLLSDEIYDQILYDDAEHVATAALAPDVFCLTFNGLSKAYRVAGFRAGWMVVSGPRHQAADYLEGLQIMANLRLCANVPSQHVIATALGSDSLNDLLLPGGRLLEQRDVTWEMLNQIDGVSCVKPTGALYCFPRLDRKAFPIEDDEAFVLDLLREQKVMVVHGRGFNWSAPDHFRIVTLPHAEVLKDAIGRIGEFLDRRRVS